MPEGDTVAGHAERLRPVLLGKTVTEVGGTAPSVRANSGRILETTVIDVRTVGKNLVIDLATGYSIRIHLGMSGYWRISGSGRSSPGPARILLGTESGRAACYAAPTVEMDRTPAIDAAVARLGPDVLGDFDEDEFLRRARFRNDVSMASMLLDQRVLAGVGNVYKSELLFLEGIHPTTPVRSVGDAQLRAVASRARVLLVANVGPKPRSTTGTRYKGRETWVYGREGLSCRRCGGPISKDSGGNRVTFWCPVCQPFDSAGA